MIVNPLVQPDKIDPITSYVDDENYMTVSAELGQWINVDIAEYEVETDDSLMPITSISREGGAMLSGQYRSYHIQASQGFLAAARFRKSANKIKFSRSFHKLDETVSYAGGLIGVVVGLFFLMSPYT